MSSERQTLVMGRKTFSFDVDEERWERWKKTVPRDVALHTRIKELLDADAEGRIQERGAKTETGAAGLTPRVVVDMVGEELNEQKRRSLLAGLEYLREEGEATAGEIAEAARKAEPVYASAKSWRSNLWNNVGKELRKTGAVELAEKSRGRWRWTD
jgi:hypothetical protein